VVGSISIISLGEGFVAGDELAATCDPRAAMRRPFITGPENALARFAVEYFFKPQPIVDPLLFYGPTGVGKSHLAVGLAEAWRGRYPRDAVVVTQGADFARSYVTALKKDAIPAFRRQYRELSLLVLEDVQQLTGKAAAQGELVRSLDEIAQQQGRVIVTASRAPWEMRNLAPALTSRLSACHTVPIALPEAQTRLAILLQLAQERGARLPTESAWILADGLPVAAPQLAGILMQLLTTTGGARKTIDVDLAQHFKAEYVDHARPTLRAITVAAAKYFDVRIGKLKGPTRQSGVVWARNIAMYLARQLTGKSYLAVGRYYGGRDRTTVMHAYRKTQQMINTDPACRQVMEDIRSLLTNCT